jgi:hypothetical protein
MGSVCGVGAFLLGSDQGNGGPCAVSGHFYSEATWLAQQPYLPPIYTYLQFSKVTGTDIDFLNNHNFGFYSGATKGRGQCAASGHFYS